MNSDYTYTKTKYLTPIVAMNAFLIVLLVSSLYFFLSYRQADESTFDAMTAVSPLWAIFIALYLPAREQLKQKQAKQDRQTRLIDTTCTVLEEELKANVRRLIALQNTVVAEPVRVEANEIVRGTEASFLRPFAAALPDKYLELPDALVKNFARRETEIFAAEDMLRMSFAPREGRRSAQAIFRAANQLLVTYARYLATIKPETFEGITIDEFRAKFENEQPDDPI